MKWVGMDDLHRALRGLPKELTQDAAFIVADAAREAHATAQANYPARTGNLRNGLKIDHNLLSAHPYGVRVRVQNTSPHARLFEVGTVARHNDIGAYRGIMPPGHVFYPAVERAKTRMFARLRAMLETHGLLVRGGDTAP